MRVVECFSALCFYRSVFNEMKRLHEIEVLRPRLVEVIRSLQEAGHIAVTCTFLEKARYTGPYLVEGEGTRFRNFQVRRLLEAHFSHQSLQTAECELIFDRHSHSASQLAEFVEYLNNNWNLPSFTSVTAVDSRYVEAIQVADLALRLFLKNQVEHDSAYVSSGMSFIRAWDVSSMFKGWTP